MVVLIFTDKFNGKTSRGALFKEAFDTILFSLPWKTTLKKPTQPEIQFYSNQYKGGDLQNWYSPNLSSSIEHNTAVAILQHSNTSWDIVLRQTYRQALVYFLASYTVLLIATFLIKQCDALTIFLLLFSLLSFYSHFIVMIRGHSGAIEKRKAISAHLDQKIRDKQ